MEHTAHRTIYGKWHIYESPDAISAYRIGPEFNSLKAAQEWLTHRKGRFAHIYRN